VEKYLDW